MADGEVRLIHAADLHGGLARYARPAPEPWGNTRVQEFEEVLKLLGSHAIETKADAVLIAGDLLDNRNPTPTILRIVSEFCARMVASGIQVLYCSGNHDGASTIGDETSHALYWLQALRKEGVHVYTRPTVEWISTPNGSFVIVAFPYPHRRAITGLDESRIRAAESPSDLTIKAGRLMTDLIRRYAKEARELADKVKAQERPVVFMGHLTALGARTSSERLMKMEWDVAIDLDVLEAFDYAALGHIHKMQGLGPRQETEAAATAGRTFDDADRRVWYAGSPVFIDFSEAGNAKGFLMVDIDIETHETVVRPLPSKPRPMSRVKLPYEGVPQWDYTRLGDLSAIHGHMVELTITGTERPPDSWVAAVEKVFRDAGVHYLKTKLAIEDQSTPRELRKEEPALDLTNKEVALRRYLALNHLPEEPYLSAARELIA